MDQPGTFGVGGRLRQAVLELKEEALAARDEADRDLATAFLRRREATARLRAVNVALRGTGELIDPDGVARRLLRKRGYAEPDPLPAPVAPQVVRGVGLREVLVDLLTAVDGDPLRPSELHRLLLADGLDVPGRPSQTIAAALAVEVRGGRVVRVGRGLYASALPRPRRPYDQCQPESAPSTADLVADNG